MKAWSEVEATGLIERLLNETLILPFGAVVVSLGTILFQALVSYIRSLRSPASEGENPDPPLSLSVRGKLERHIISRGGPLTFSYQAARLFGGIALLVLNFITPCEPNIPEKLLVQRDRLWAQIWHGAVPFTEPEVLKLLLGTVYLYTTLLSLLTIILPKRWATTASLHTTILYLLTLLVFTYRDLYSLVTIDGRPQDGAEGPLLWIKIATLFFVGAVIPLVTPREYVPFDPKNPMKPNPEQTASWLSMATYSFLDPLVFLAYRVPHLGYDLLPPLADYDHTHNLKSANFKHLDVFSGASNRHIFFGLMKTFWFQYIMMGTFAGLMAICHFVSPICINRLLSYLETNGLGATIQPWVWIVGLFIGPLATGATNQAYIFFATATLVRCEAIITQLVFEHALRIRVKAEAENDKEAEPPAPSQTPATPIAESINESTGTEIAPSQPEEPEHTRDDTAVSTGAFSSSEETARSSSLGTNPTPQKQHKDDKNKGKKTDEPPAGTRPSASNLVGRINNLVTTDLGNITDARDFMYLLIYMPLQVILSMVFLYLMLGWSTFVGLAILILLFPIPGWITKKIQQVQQSRMKRTDARVEVVTEAMNVIRMVKLFGWEKKIEDRISEKREEELVWLWRKQVLELVNGNINFIIPVFAMAATYSTYVRFPPFTLIMKQELKPSIAFSSMTMFDILRDQIHFAFYRVDDAVVGKVSLDRVNDFLKNTELLDSYSGKDRDPLFGRAETDDGRIGFNASSFTWSVDTDGALTPSTRKYMLKIEQEVLFKPGCLNLIVGPTGSGKTSILMALLGEMHYIPNGPNSWFNLPRKGGVAYAAQESWVQNETIRENILFGAPYDEERYRKVIYQCALERDLELFEAGDQTEVGEKGLTLSGGQKARVTLARAIYSPARIVLLDDILAALDVHTGKWIVDKCLAGDLVKGRTILLVTHNIAMTRSLAEFAVSIGTDGTIVAQGTIPEVLGSDTTVFEEFKQDQEAVQAAEEEIDKREAPSSDGKLIVAEEIDLGHVSWKAIKLFLVGLGGSYPALFFTSFLGGLLIFELLHALQTWFLGYWASQYQHHPASEVSVPYYLSTYVGILCMIVVVYMATSVIFIYGIIRASRSLHNRLVGSVLGTTLRWLDTTPTSRIITRCTQDIRAVDGPLKDTFTSVVELTMAMLVKFSIIVFMTPFFLIPGITAGALGRWIGQIYMAAQLSVKREMSNAKAPVVGHFGAAIAGLTSIRAYAADEMFVSESLKRINRYTSAARTFYNLNRWVSLRIDAIGGLFAAGLGMYLVYFQNNSASNVGFLLNLAVIFSSMILWWVRNLNDFEVEGNSLERIRGYLVAEQESKPTPEGVPPAYWPAGGSLVVDKLSARYSLNGPKVLHDISFEVKSGERVGVVGRTGSGKSSLTLALLRCIFTEGDVYYDGIKTSDVNLDALRSKITIIPQIPELLSGSLRHNLDPFDQYDDATLNDALRAAGLFTLQAEMDEGRITLDTKISSGGGNLSIGQRQILALARAIVRNSKLLILDEATSAIDHKTDTAIQSSLRNELGHDTTVITIAHRLQTIMDADKIMVLDAGRIVEYGSPSDLVRREKGFLHSLVEESGDKEHLYEMAEGRCGVDL